MRSADPGPSAERISPKYACRRHQRSYLGRSADPGLSAERISPNARWWHQRSYLGRSVDPGRSAERISPNMHAPVFIFGEICGPRPLCRADPSEYAHRKPQRSYLARSADPGPSAERISPNTICTPGAPAFVFGEICGPRPFPSGFLQICTPRAPAFGFGEICGPRPLCRADLSTHAGNASVRIWRDLRTQAPLPSGSLQICTPGAPALLFGEICGPRPPCRANLSKYVRRKHQRSNLGDLRTQAPLPSGSLQICMPGAPASIFGEICRPRRLCRADLSKYAGREPGREPGGEPGREPNC